jgi:predicted nucleotidyltransferase
VLQDHPQAAVWLFGSLARGDWDAYSDVDLLAIGPSTASAQRLAEALQSACLGDDVLALSSEDWHRLRSGDDPYWRVIGAEAVQLDCP